MQSFVAHRSETQVDAGTIGSFATKWQGAQCSATAGDGTNWVFSVQGWANGQAHAYQPNEEQPVGAYQLKAAMSNDGEVTFRGAPYEITHSGMLRKTYLLKKGETELINLHFKRGYVLGDTVEGEIAPDLDPGLALFFVWLVYIFRNEDLWMASAPPALS